MERKSASTTSPRKTYACHICDRSFIRVHRLQSHIRTHNKRNINSDITTPSLNISGSQENPAIDKERKNYKCVKLSPIQAVSKLIQDAVANNKEIECRKLTKIDPEAECPNSLQNPVENKMKDGVSTPGTVPTSKQPETYITASPVEAGSMLCKNQVNNKNMVTEKGVTTHPVSDSLQTPSGYTKVNVLTTTVKSNSSSEENKVDVCEIAIPSPAIVHPTDHTSNYDPEIIVKTEFIDEVVEITSEEAAEATPKRNRVHYSCNVCQMPFTNKCHLGRHMLTHTKEKPYVCNVCFRGFTQIGNLNIHYRIHSSTDQNPANTDPAATYKTSTENCKLHIVTEPKSDYVCEVCNKQFRNKCYLERHVLTHTKEKPHVCTVCFKGFAQIGNLNVHYLTHADSKSFVCHVCGKAFTLMGSLKAHHFTHVEQKPFKCDVCNKGFSNSCFLKRHLLTHTDLKPYVCSVCHKGFAQVGNLNVHLLTHTKERDFQCEICHKKFLRKVYLEKHYKLQHLRENNAVN